MWTLWGDSAFSDDPIDPQPSTQLSLREHTASSDAESRDGAGFRIEQGVRQPRWDEIDDPARCNTCSRPRPGAWPLRRHSGLSAYEPGPGFEVHLAAPIGPIGTGPATAARPEISAGARRPLVGSEDHRREGNGVGGDPSDRSPRHSRGPVGSRMRCSPARHRRRCDGVRPRRGGTSTARRGWARPAAAPARCRTADVGWVVPRGLNAGNTR